MENITMGKSSPSIDHPTINSIRKERCGEIKQNTHNIRDNDDVEPSSDRNVLLWKTMEAKMMLWSDNSKVSLTCSEDESKEEVWGEEGEGEAEILQDEE